jgi:quercetin dioxygenase-like cupin family protein
MRTAYVVNKGTHPLLDVFGPTVEFLTVPDESEAIYSVMIGTIPPGVAVPLHSHPDVESFFMLSGAVEVLSYQGTNHKWLAAKTGDFVHVPGGAKHAFRNLSREPVVQLITTTPKLARFFEEIGRPVVSGASPGPPSADDLQHFASVAAKYDYWLGSPAENAAIGVSFF